MADRLSQLQDCLDQLATQFYASVRYLSTHHASSALDDSPNPHQPVAPANETVPTQRPDSPSTFTAAQKELAHDLIVKTKQIEYLISVLPGLDKSDEMQEARIRELEMKLRTEEEKRKQAVVEKEVWLKKLDTVIGKVRR